MQTKTIRSVWLTVLFYFDKHIKDKDLYRKPQSQFFLPKAYHDKKNKANLWKKRKFKSLICRFLGMFHPKGYLYRRMIFSYFSRIWIHPSCHIG